MFFLCFWLVRSCNFGFFKQLFHAGSELARRLVGHVIVKASNDNIKVPRVGVVLFDIADSFIQAAAYPVANHGRLADLLANDNRQAVVLLSVRISFYRQSPFSGTVAFFIGTVKRAEAMETVSF